MTIFERFTDPRWLSNVYLVADGHAGTAVIIDSGAPLEPMFDALVRHRLSLAAILTTHRHIDHTGGHDELGRRTRAPIYALSVEAPHVPGARPLQPEEVRVWGTLRVSAIPLHGHTAGHAGYLVQGVGLFTGDCVFARSLGSTIGEGSSGFADAHRAVERFLALPDATPVHPGHGGPTTVGAERADNPFLRVMSGRAPEGRGRCRALGRPARLVVLAPDYDGGTKAWVRFDDEGADALIPGSRVEVLS
ncbi:MAG: hypothetical protein AUH92_01815 [Acidobacteria bacterium 13_1_40CM_4_69_4]|nr:MAG: hypothetical protein AUH92_01815 [Acidobacteria bacterium 13_1_40CM_4_69_4]